MIGRILLGVAGVAAALWGVWLMADFTGEQLRSAGLWLVGGVIVHDAILAPLTVLLGVLLLRVRRRGHAHHYAEPDEPAPADS